MLDPAGLTQTIDQFADFLLRYAVALAAVGSLTMAILEAIKRVWRLRERYHQNAVRRWIRGSITPDISLGAPDYLKRLKFKAALQDGAFNDNRDHYDFHDWVYYELLHLTTGTSPDRIPSMQRHERPTHRRTLDMALFSLPLEKMMGQIQDAADTAVSHPAIYPFLYSFLVAGAGRADTDRWFDTAVSGTAISNVDSSDPQFAAKRNENRMLTDAYSRLTKFVRHRLDSFQLVTGYTWREANQFWAVCVGFVMMLVALITLEQGELDQLQSAGNWPALTGELLAIACASLIGGVLAPIAKDLVSALGRVRGGN
jgi:hypothetical protein